jgi:hypothetical protein
MTPWRRALRLCTLPRMPKAKAALRAAMRYVKRKPDVLLDVAVNAAGRKVTVPLDVLRYFAEQASGSKKAPKDVLLEAVPPALRVSASVDAMGTPIRFSATIKIEEISVSTEEIRLVVRLSHVSLKLLGEGGNSPIAALIQSGALDLSKPGNLAKFMPNRPKALVEAEDDRLVLDLLRDPKIAGNPKVQKMLSLVTPILSVRGVATESDALCIALQPKLAGVPQVVETIRSQRRARP